MTDMTRRTVLALTATILATGSVSAQSATDALQITQPDFRGTARFMGMGGAFTALGGDLSTLTQNPAGIGIYRHSEIGATLDITFMNNKTTSAVGDSKLDHTKAACNNFGYIGVANIGSTLESFQWGVTYNRTAQIDRSYYGYANPTQTSLTNYIATYSNKAGYTGSDLDASGSGYNPYRDSDYDWLSILAYNSGMMNDDGRRMVGLYNNGTTADAEISVREHGYTDEYSFNFGGNISNVVYWGLGIGVTDLSYTRTTIYSESLEHATIYSRPEHGLVDDGNAGYTMYNNKHISGNGWKLSLGLIVKPIEELRIGLAFHTPTWWTLSQNYEAAVDYSYFDPMYPEGSNNPNDGSHLSDYADFDWRLSSPWRMMAGVATVIGGKAIVSADYERLAYNDMTARTPVYDYYGYLDSYQSNENLNNEIKTYSRAANIIRVGAEYRVTPKFSVRLGYNFRSSSTSKETENGGEVITSGTDPSFNLNKTASNISFGLGYRFGAFYIDGTYVHKQQKSTLCAYTDFDGLRAPRFDATESNNAIVLSLGYRF